MVYCFLSGFLRHNGTATEESEFDFKDRSHIFDKKCLGNNFFTQCPDQWHPPSDTLTYENLDVGDGWRDNDATDSDEGEKCPRSSEASKTPSKVGVFNMVVFCFD